jgi:hypothetical protein
VAAPANVVAGILELALQIAADIKSLGTTKADKTNVVDLLTAQTVAGIKTFTSPPAVLPIPTLSSNSQLVHKKYVDDAISNVVAGTGATQVPANYVPAVDRDVLNLGYSRRKEYFIDATQLKNYVNSDTDAVKLAAIQWNTNVGLQAIKNNPNKLIVFDPEQAWPIQLTLSGFDTTNFPTVDSQVPVRIKGRFKQPVGSFVSQAEADAWKNTGSNPNGRVPSATVIEVTRTWGAPQDISSTGRVIFGPNLPPWYQPSQDATQIVLSAAAYSGWQLGDAAVICSNDSYAFSVRATNSDNVWKAQYLEVNAIGIDVANYTVAAVSSANVAAGRSSLTPDGNNNGMEARWIKGATSLTQALVRGDTGNAQLLFTSLPAAFQLGEQLIDVQTSQPIGTVGKQYLVVPGKLDDAYTTTPCIRKVRRDIPIVMDIEVESAVDTNTVIASWNRPTSIAFSGTYDHAIKANIKSGLGRGVSFTSSKRGRAELRIAGLPNFALENDLGEGAYGYGGNTLGCTEDLLFIMDVENVRHGFTTNVLGGTWNLKAGGGSGTHAQSTNYFKYGTTRNVTIEGSFRYTFGAGIDTHEGARNVVMQNFKVIKPFWGGRILSGGTGINTRGHNTVIQNGYIEDVRDGISDAGQNIVSGTYGSLTIVKNVIVNGFQLSGYTSGESSNYSTAESYIEDCVFIGDNSVLTSELYQAGLVLGYGKVITKGVVIRQVNGAMIIHKGTASNATPPRQGGVGIHIAPVFDFRNGNAATGIRYESHMDSAALVEPVIIAAGVNRPQYLLRHEVGAPASPYSPTNVQYQGIKLVQTVTPVATPALTYNGAIVNGVPTAAGTATRIADFGEAAAAAALPAGGTTGQVLRKNSATDGDVAWGTVREVPVGGSAGQLLKKTTSADGDTSWTWLPSSTKVNVDGTFQATLDIDSTPPVKIVSVDADFAGPVSGTTVQDITPLQTLLPAGTYDIEAAVIYSMTSGTAGSPRLGLGGAGASAASLPAGVIQSTQGTSAATQSGSRFWLTTLGIAGTAASYPSAAGQAPVAGQNVAGVGVGSFALPISWEVIGKVTLTAPGVIGLVGQVSSGGDRLMTIKAGSKIKFTRTA